MEVDQGRFTSRLYFSEMLVKMLSLSCQMTCLEYWWNMKYQTLNLNTHYNIFPDLSPLPLNLSEG